MREWRVLVIGENGQHAQNWWYKECHSLKRAFEAYGCKTTLAGKGHDIEIDDIDFNDFHITFDAENYDSGWIPYNRMKKSNVFSIKWAIDTHTHGLPYFLNLVQRGGYDLLLQATKDYITTNCQMAWFPNCIDPTLIYPIANTPKRAQLGFCGNIANRGQWLKTLQDQKKYTFVADIFVIGDAMVEAINSYDVQFNMNVANDINFRSFETIGCGTILATNFNPQYIELGFKDMENSILYSNGQDLMKKLEVVFNDDEIRKKISDEGYKLSKRHTYEQRVKHLMDWITSPRNGFKLCDSLT